VNGLAPSDTSFTPDASSIAASDTTELDSVKSPAVVAAPRPILHVVTVPPARAVWTSRRTVLHTMSNGAVK
jgi:hypothetical protein